MIVDSHADELQALLQPTNTGGELDVDGANYIRDNVWRRILIGSPPTVLWAVTGSSMALMWAALAAMPVYGEAPLRYVWPVSERRRLAPRLHLRRRALRVHGDSPRHPSPPSVSSLFPCFAPAANLAIRRLTVSDSVTVPLCGYPSGYC